MSGSEVVQAVADYFGGQIETRGYPNAGAWVRSAPSVFNAWRSGTLPVNVARAVFSRVPSAAEHAYSMIHGFPAESGWAQLDQYYRDMFVRGGRDPMSGFRYPSNPRYSGGIPSPTWSGGKRDVEAALREGARNAAENMRRRLFGPAPPPPESRALVPYVPPVLRRRGGPFDPRRLPLKYRRGLPRSRKLYPSLRARPPRVRSEASRSTNNVALLSKLPMSFLRGQRAPRSFRVV
jgi:hypothetical protein